MTGLIRVGGHYLRASCASGRLRYELPDWEIPVRCAESDRCSDPPSHGRSATGRPATGHGKPCDRNYERGEPSEIDTRGMPGASSATVALSVGATVLRTEVQDVLGTYSTEGIYSRGIYNVPIHRAMHRGQVATVHNAQGVPSEGVYLQMERRF